MPKNVGAFTNDQIKNVNLWPNFTKNIQLQTTFTIQRSHKLMQIFLDFQLKIEIAFIPIEGIRGLYSIINLNIT